MVTVSSTAALKALVGQTLGPSDWLVVSQQQIDTFAEATGDRQWIHVDTQRAATDSPYGTTIAHGFLTLSLVSALVRAIVAFDGLRMAINYGLNRVRFVAAVPAGSRIRASLVLDDVTDVADGVQATWQVTVEREGQSKPCLVAEWLVRYYP